MAFDYFWSMTVWASDGTYKGMHRSDIPPLTGTPGIVSLDSFSVDAAGGCIDATFTAVPSLVDIAPRDIILLQLGTVGGAAVDRWKGMITQAGNPRAPGAQTYRAVGLRRRFYESSVPLYDTAGGDVGTIVRIMLNYLTMPAGVTFSTANTPLQEFVAGIRYPGLETVGDYLDAYAAMVPAFVVPTGSTYTYDGTTYTAGQTVPATVWGVNASGEVFFRRPKATAATASEIADGTLVEWTPLSAEEKADAAWLVYAGGLDLRNLRAVKVAVGGGVVAVDPSVQPAAPVARLLGSGASSSRSVRTERVVQLDNPLDFMAEAPLVVSIPALGGTWSGIQSATDASDTTYASTTGYGTLRFTVGGMGNVVTKFTGIWRVKLRVQDLTDDFSNQVYAYIGRTQALGTDYTAAWYRVPAEGTGQDVEMFVVAAPFHEETGTYPHDAAYLDVTVTGTGSNAARIYDVSFYVPDSDTVDTGSGAVALGTASERIASAYERAPAPEAAAVTIYGIRSATQTLTLTPRSGGAMTLPIERTEYRVTRKEGVVSIFHVGQAWDASLEAERVILERLARRAVAEGGANR